MKRVIIESPYADETNEKIARNVEYARACIKDSLSRGEAPFASHLLYTQPGILDDSDMELRMFGIHAGFTWSDVADLVAVYTDFGTSAGMSFGLEKHVGKGLPIEYRSLPEYANPEDSRPCDTEPSE